MMGKSRSKGHRAELEMVHYLRAHGYPDARTTRSELGHDGTRQPGDVIFDDDVLLEVKNRKESRWPTWCEKAHAEAGLRVPVVVRKVGAHVENWPMRVWTFVKLSPGLSGYPDWERRSFGEWLSEWRQAGDE